MSMAAAQAFLGIEPEDEAECSDGDEDSEEDDWAQYEEDEEGEWSADWGAAEEAAAGAGAVTAGEAAGCMGALGQVAPLCVASVLSVEMHCWECILLPSRRSCGAASALSAPVDLKLRPIKPHVLCRHCTQLRDPAVSRVPEYLCGGRGAASHPEWNRPCCPSCCPSFTPCSACCAADRGGG